MDPIISAAIPLVGIFLILLLGKKSTLHSSIIFMFISVLVFVTSTYILLQNPIDNVIPFANNLFLDDAISRLFVALVTSVLVGASFYIHNRVLVNNLTTTKLHELVLRTLFFFSISVLAILSNHLLFMLILLEASTLAITPLIFHEKSKESLQAAWRYLMFSLVALGLVLLGILCFAKGLHARPGMESVSFFFTDLSGIGSVLGKQPWRDLGLVLIFFGISTKLGLAPMYNWLPAAYDRAPQSTTVMLSAVQFNVVMVMIFRVMQYFSPLQSPIVRYFLITVGLVSILISLLHIVAEKHYKRLIAYASINHAGVIAIGLGLSLGKDSAYGVLIYVISNTLVKAMLFLACGNIFTIYKTEEMSGIKKLIKRMPVTGWAFLIGVFALLGFAPFGSFFGELFIMKSMIDGRYFAVFASFGFLMTLVFVAVGRTTFPMIWGNPPEELSPAPESFFALMPIIFFTLLLISMGIYIPAGANELLQKIATIIGGGV
ncbi:MAG: hypothetical protein A2504_07315 [Bdellovibrionales bacterium RIFOXYD12_FULL_39_22]|nr:MAG: hypothetical protein A2385_16685 [Bdellovibrionales bacterium RIFOXYB1_FULL_39_21]OFZ44687.1 MAG: hypothetical protein A2485_14545 [Bdellovibrionales bacterium RIFOXYC12_FULL_39_17]OFZ49317.1 MAG: hypothetical protein A2404_08840 [Bdellovibrionales bacterium RIFOXYC1_FULL_39_130]OFZ76801.1 MAG: hypothetical protein A2451_05740 [Bdellovibrionales bacterium RIFOXYC2_FULL_39_8]OFZ77053.1 MAG: hypothetical protein A2560_09805 [Bdellovibrionales bacterium RIFOXYD1_FULL_39_84]OFZ95313.1 MAG: